MPTFTAIALDRLLEPGASKSVEKTTSNSMFIPKSKPVPKSKPIPNSKLERRNSSPTVEKKIQHPLISPALYTTPQATPLPDSPTSFPPSPYIINHKRRGPRLLKSYSEDDVASRQKVLDEEKVNENKKNEEGVELTKDASVTFTIANPVEEEHVNGARDRKLGSSNEVLKSKDGEHGNSVLKNGLAGETGSNSLSNGLCVENDTMKLVSMNSERDSEVENFFDLQESMSFSGSTDGEDNNGAERALNLATPMGEFYDAWEELSEGGVELSEGGAKSTLRDIESELREMRLSVLMEIEKRKQAEEALNNVRSQWQRIRQQLSTVGLTLPADLSAVADGGQLEFDLAEELCQQVYLARFVSESIGRGIAKAEVETELEAQIESKNFEIARLWDRLHYYETVNSEMSQRNQEAVEMGRRDRQRRKRRQRWVWGSIAAAITLGSAALAWSYLPTGNGSSSTNHSQAPEHDDAAK